MLALENVNHLLCQLRDLSVMFSPWWSRSNDVQQVASAGHSDGLLGPRKKSASFRLSTSVNPDVSELESVKLSKRKSKHKRSKSKRRSTETLDGVGEITSKQKKSLVATESVKDELSIGQVTSNKKRESCRVINLKIPLPDDAAMFLSRYYYHNPYKDYPQSTGDTPIAKSREETSHRSKRTKRKNGARKSSDASMPCEQPMLKSVELVSFATEEQMVGDVYAQHQRSARPLSSSAVTPSPSSSAPKYSSIMTLTEPSATCATPTHHSQPCFTMHSTPLGKTYPSTALTDPLESSLKSQTSFHPCRRSMQDYIFRPVFRFSHRNGTPGLMNSSYPLTTCGCADGCRLCLANVRMVHPAPLTLDGYKHSPINFNRSRRGSLDSCCRLDTSLPPLKLQVDDSYGDLHALGHSVTKYPPKATERKNGKVSLASASMRSTREPPVPSYPDALTNGPPGYHRRLSQMAILVSETIRWEKEKPKSKSKKSSKGSQGSL